MARRFLFCFLSCLLVFSVVLCGTLTVSAAGNTFMYSVNEPAAWFFANFENRSQLFSVGIGMLNFNSLIRFSVTSSGSTVELHASSSDDISTLTAALVSASDTSIDGYVAPSSYLEGETVAGMKQPNVATWTFTFDAAAGSLLSCATNRFYAGDAADLTASVMFADSPPEETEKAWYESFGDWFTGLGDRIAGFFNNLGASISSSLSGLGDRIIDVIEDMFNVTLWADFDSFIARIWSDNDVDQELDNITNSLLDSVVTFGPALAFVSHYVAGMASGMSGILVIYILPMFLGMIFFVLSKVPGVTRVESTGSYDTVYTDSNTGVTWTEHSSGIKWKLRGR